MIPIYIVISEGTPDGKYSEDSSNATAHLSKFDAEDSIKDSLKTVIKYSGLAYDPNSEDDIANAIKHHVEWNDDRSQARFTFKKCIIKYRIKRVEVPY